MGSAWCNPWQWCGFGQWRGPHQHQHSLKMFKSLKMSFSTRYVLFYMSNQRHTGFWDRKKQKISLDSQMGSQISSCNYIHSQEPSFSYSKFEIFKTNDCFWQCWLKLILTFIPKVWGEEGKEERKNNPGPYFLQKHIFFFLGHVLLEFFFLLLFHIIGLNGT